VALDLVHGEHNRRRDAAQATRDLLVERREPVAHVDHEHDEVRKADGGRDLALDLLAEVVAVDDADAAGVDDLDPALACGAVELGGERDTVARDARRRLDDRDARAAHAVRERRLADIGAPDDRDAAKPRGRAHGTPSTRCI
jgi:hypothetical protein